MTGSKLRRQIACDAARLMYQRQESEYYRAKMKAARRLTRSRVKPADLPSNGEIRDQIQLLARLMEGDQRTDRLRDMRLAALRIMRMLEPYRPRLIGSVMTGHVRQGSDIDIHVFSDSLAGVTGALEAAGLVFDIERKRVKKHGEERAFTHIHVQDEFPLELTLYASSLSSYVFKSSVTGKAIERASIAELEQFLAQEYPDMNLDAAMADVENRPDRFQLYESLLLPLENVKQDPRWHPEGDVLYHSLQVFDLARDEHPWDEEFLLAALLHDIGKGIDPHDHVSAALDALSGYITERTAWLIENHMLAHQVHDGKLGQRARRRLQENESYEELLTLSTCDRNGREPGVEAPELEEAIEYLRELAQTCG